MEARDIPLRPFSLFSQGLPLPSARGHPPRVRILDRYILGEWAKVFGLALASLGGLAAISISYRHARDFIEWDSGAGDFAVFLILRLVGELPLLIPVTLLISVVFVLGQLNRNQELAAARAAGQSVLRLTAPLWFAAAALAGLLAFLNAAWVSSSQEAARQLAEGLEFRALEEKGRKVRASGDSELVAFDNPGGGRRWIIGRLSLAAGRASDVHLHLLAPDGRELRRLAAAYAEFAREGERWRWTFRDVREMAFDPVTQELVRQPRFDLLELPEVDEDPEVMAATVLRPQKLSFRELRLIAAHAGWMPEGRMAQFAMRYHRILASPMVCLVVVAIAIPFAVAGGRVNPMIGVSKTLGLFLGYYFLTLVLDAVGSAGHLPPLLAAWIPPLALALWALPRLREVN
jgi:lipopolysaccharide export system permease protein